MLSVFFLLVFCAWLGVLCLVLAVLLFFVGLAFFDRVLPRLLLYGGSSPKLSGKILLASGLLFVGSFSLPLVFRRRRFFFSFCCKRYRAGSNTTPPHALVLVFSFSPFCPAAVGLSPFLAVRPVSWRFFGVPFWAPRVFGILLQPTGLELAHTFRGPFLGRKAARVFPCFLCLVFFSPLLFCFATPHVLLEGPPMARPTAGPGRSTSRPSPE